MTANRLGVETTLSVVQHVCLVIVFPKLERVGLEGRLTDLSFVDRSSLPLRTTPPGQVSTTCRSVDVRLGDHVIKGVLRDGSGVLRWILLPVTLGRVVGRVRMVRRSGTGIVRFTGLLSLHCSFVLDWGSIERTGSTVNHGWSERHRSRIRSIMEHRHVF